MIGAVFIIILVFLLVFSEFHNTDITPPHYNM